MCHAMHAVLAVTGKACSTGRITVNAAKACCMPTSSVPIARNTCYVGISEDAPHHGHQCQLGVQALLATHLIPRLPLLNAMPLPPKALMT